MYIKLFMRICVSSSKAPDSGCSWLQPLAVDSLQWREQPPSHSCPISSYTGCLPFTYIHVLLAASPSHIKLNSMWTFSHFLEHNILRFSVTAWHSECCTKMGKAFCESQGLVQGTAILLLQKRVGLPCTILSYEDVLLQPLTFKACYANLYSDWKVNFQSL